ncbi:MAG TPA: hypothetical protein VNB94_12975 [Mycobacteriales bacterium]|nr:hypothetical protein [Mycobacteriales bacterium]
MTEPTLPLSPDDDDEGWGDLADETDAEAARRLDADRPPHHDRD